MIRNNEVLYSAALSVAKDNPTVTISLIQIRLKIGYKAACDIVNKLNSNRIIAPRNDFGYESLVHNVRDNAHQIGDDGQTS